MILRLDHVGLLTGDPQQVGTFLTALGMRRTRAGVAADYGVECEFWNCDTPGPAIELVAPLNTGSTASNYLAKKGAGLYHLAFEVDELEAERDRLRGHGFVPVDRTPCRGAIPGMRVSFLYLRDPANLLVELVRYTEPAPEVSTGGGPR